MESAAEGEGIWGQEGGFGSRTIFSLCHVPKAVGFGAMVARGNLGFPAEGPRCGGRERGINVLGHSSSPPQSWDCGELGTAAPSLVPYFLPRKGECAAPATNGQRKRRWINK